MKILPDAQYQECTNLSLSRTPFLRDYDSMQQLFSQLVSPFGQRSVNKRREVIDSFEEMQLDLQTTLALEGTPPSHLFLLLSGEVTVFKKPEALF